MSEITNQPLYLIKFDDTEVPDETMFGAEVANKRFEQISGNWNAHLFVKVASNSRDDACSGSNAKLASDYGALAAQCDEGLAREAELKRQLKETPIPQEIAAELERTDWTPEQALKWYAEGKHFDVVASRTRIIDTGHVASNALKHLSADYLEHKGDAQLHELQQRLAKANALLQESLPALEQASTAFKSIRPVRSRVRDYLAGRSGCADSERAAAPAVNLPRRKVKTEYSTAEEDAQTDAWNAALDAVQELNK